MHKGDIMSISDLMSGNESKDKSYNDIFNNCGYYSEMPLEERHKLYDNIKTIRVLTFQNIKSLYTDLSNKIIYSGRARTIKQCDLKYVIYDEECIDDEAKTSFSEHPHIYSRSFDLLCNDFDKKCFKLPIYTYLSFELNRSESVDKFNNELRNKYTNYTHFMNRWHFDRECIKAFVLDIPMFNILEIGTIGFLNSKPTYITKDDITEDLRKTCDLGTMLRFKNKTMSDYIDITFLSNKLCMDTEYEVVIPFIDISWVNSVYDIDNNFTRYSIDEIINIICSNKDDYKEY